MVKEERVKPGGTGQRGGDAPRHSARPPRPRRAPSRPYSTFIPQPARAHRAPSCEGGTRTGATAGTRVDGGGGTTGCAHPSQRPSEEEVRGEGGGGWETALTGLAVWGAKGRRRPRACVPLVAVSPAKACCCCLVVVQRAADRRAAPSARRRVADRRAAPGARRRGQPTFPLPYAPHHPPYIALQPSPPPPTPPSPPLNPPPTPTPSFSRYPTPPPACARAWPPQCPRVTAQPSRRRPRARRSCPRRCPCRPK